MDCFECFFFAEVPGWLAGAWGVEGVEDCLRAWWDLSHGGLGVEDFADTGSCEFVGACEWGSIEDSERSCGEFDDRDSCVVVVVEGDGAEVGGLLVEHEGFVDKGAWRDDLGDSAFDDAFGFFWVFELIDDGDAVSGVDCFLEVV